MSVLAHVVSRSLPPEPTATQALAYILRESEALAAFVDALAFTGVSFKPVRVEAEAALGDGRPDLKIHDGRGRHRVLVENMFWAGLTTPSRQRTWKEMLGDGASSSAPVFVVPTARMRSIWGELVRRCREAHLEVGDQVEGSATAAARLDDDRVIAVTTWEHVLTALELVGSVRSDIRQLRALTDRMDAEAFLPIRPDELTDVGVARRLINYTDLGKV